ncbi:uncharacterized protein [Apostichopus japonicus]
MQNYWIPRFLIHCKLRFNKKSGRTALKVYRPNFYIVEVQSLTDINLSSEDDQPANSSNRSSTTKNITMKRQRFSNLLSMFSSNTARHSEISALINLEDTGETTMPKDVENQPHDSYLDHREWLAEEFPLPDISEESLISSSRNSSAKIQRELSPLPIEYPPLTPSPEVVFEKVPLLDAIPMSISRREITQKNKSLVKLKQSLLSVMSNDTMTNVKSSDPQPIADRNHELSESDVIIEKEEESSENVSSPVVDTLQEKAISPLEEETSTTRYPSATPYGRSSTGTPSSLTITSTSNQSIQTPSRRRMTVSSPSHHAASSSSIGSSTRMANSGTPKKASKPPARRNRSMSISFRLADFSFMADSDHDESKKEQNTQGSTLVLPKLDIAALQEARSKAVERKKMEDRQRMVEMIKKKKKQKKGSSRATDDKSSKEKKRGRRGKEINAKQTRLSKDKNEQIAKLTMRNLEKFNVQNNVNPRAFLRRRLISDGEYGRYRRASDQSSLGTSQSENRNIALKDLKSTETLTAYPESRSSMTNLPSLYNVSARAITFEELDSDYGRVRERDDDDESSQQIRGAILSDRVAGKPWETFLKKIGKYEALNHLMFWQMTQELLVHFKSDKSDRSPGIVKQLLVQRMTALYLVPSGKRYVSIGKHLSSELRHCLETGSNIPEILLRVQKMAVETLSASWKTFQKHDTDEFLMRTAYRKNFARSTLPRGSILNASSENVLDKDSQLSLVSQETSNHMLKMLKNVRGKTDKGREVDTSDRLTVAPHRMWKAFQLTEGILYSSRDDEDDDLSDPSDPEVDSEDEGSLRRPKMAVYKEKKQLESTVHMKATKPKERTIIISREKREQTQSLPQANESSSTISRPKEAKGVCTAIRKNGKTIYRPPRPKLFQDVLRDPSHLEFFRRFLIKENSEIPLQFWNAVEQMRTSCRDAKSRQNKTILIVRKFFGKATDFGAALQCDADVIQDIPMMEKVTPQMILSAQACVARSMEEKWFDAYKDTFPEDSIDSDSDSSETDRKLAPREKSKALWAMFINNVTSFRRGLMNAASLKAFKDFLGKEVRREVEKQEQTGIQSKRMISNKVVIVEKLLNDLSFWAEVERFKDLADNAARAASAGTYTLEDEDYVQQKARSIIDCFLHSQVPPKVQINIPQEMADDILECADSGLIERGLFHDAALYIFTVLLYCWKRFCRERFSPSQDSDVDMTSQAVKGKKRKKKRKSTTPTVCGVKIKTVTGTSVDDPPKLHFTLQHGLQLVLPPKPRQEDLQRQRLRQLLRQLYPNADETSIEYYLKQHLGDKPLGLGEKLPQPTTGRRLSKAFISNTTAGSSLAVNLLQRRLTRQFDGGKPILMQKQDSSHNNKDILTEV